MKTSLIIIAIAAFYAFFFTGVVKRWGRVVDRAVDRLQLVGSRSVRELEAIGKLGAAAFAQAAFACLLLVLIPVPFFSSPGIRFDLILLGVLLGLGEMALSRFACTLLVTFTFKEDAPAGRHWRFEFRSGWMGLFANTARAAPKWLAIGLITLYVAGEELVFRGIALQALREFGPLPAVAGSTALFVAVQAFNMPIRAAVFPMVGAVIVGLVHGILMLRTDELMPLIAAHLSFFFSALPLGFSNPRFNRVA